MLSEMQKERTALGKTLSLDVGCPKESAVLANGDLAQVRDDLGLPVDPKAFAKPTCRQCRGEGTIILIKPLVAKTLSALPDRLQKMTDDFVELNAHGKPFTRSMCVCACSISRRKKIRRQFAQALLDKGLAVCVSPMNFGAVEADDLTIALL